MLSYRNKNIFIKNLNFDYIKKNLNLTNKELLTMFFFKKKKLCIQNLNFSRIVLNNYYFYFFNKVDVSYVFSNKKINYFNFVLKKKTTSSALSSLLRFFQKNGKLSFSIKIVTRSLEKINKILFANYVYIHFFGLIHDIENSESLKLLFLIKDCGEVFHKDIFNNIKTKNSSIALFQNNNADNSKINISDLQPVFDYTDNFLVIFFKYYNFFILTKK